MTIIAILALMLTYGILPVQTQAATIIPEELNESSDPLEIQQPSASFTQLLIERLQRALVTIGIYRGAITGVIDDETDRAIRQYQRSERLSLTGIIDEGLVSRLETAIKVGAMLDKLSIARQTHTEEAHNALLANPATSGLIVEGQPDEAANPVRDPSACFASPTVRCLLDEALESAKAIPRDEMRDWALGDILVAQARAGLSEAARSTVRRISDPRMIMVALGEIAEAQARAGQAKGAISAANTIPDLPTRIETYASIADIMSNADLGDGVTEAVAQLRQQTDDLEPDAKLIAHQAQASAALFRAGKQEEAIALLAETETAANNIQTADNRDTALRHVADTYAGIGHIDHAITILDTIENTAERVPVLMSAARAWALEGDPGAALEMAASIDAVRYRALVLASIAEGQARIGNLPAAITTLEKATAEMNSIDLPFARDYATSRISLAYAAIASGTEQPNAEMFLQATALAKSINDEKTLAYSVWTIAFFKQNSGFGIPQENKANAFMITEQIQSTSGRAWLLAELAEKHADDGHGEWAWDMFDRALNISESIKNSWGRARSLSRLSLSLIRLVETGAIRSTVDHLGDAKE